MVKIKNSSKDAIKRIYNAFFYSVDGVKSMFASGPAFRQDLGIFAIGAAILFFVNVSRAELAVMMLSLFLLLMAETVNTAIETVIDRISTKIHPLSKKAKDIGSFLVLLALVNLITVWGIILLF